MMFALFAEGKKDGACVYGHSAAVAAPWQEAAEEAGATGTAFDLCALPEGQQTPLKRCFLFSPCQQRPLFEPAVIPCTSQPAALPAPGLLLLPSTPGAAFQGLPKRFLLRAQREMEARVWMDCMPPPACVRMLLL